MPHMLCTLLMRRHTERPKSRRNADFAVVNSNERPEMQARMEWSFEQLIPSAHCGSFGAWRRAQLARTGSRLRFTLASQLAQ
eukprot:6188502-Pleurochrysis_carterae.AAC.5